jgi:hypothetical protein
MNNDATEVAKIRTTLTGERWYFDDVKGYGASPRAWWCVSLAFPGLWVLFPVNARASWCAVDDFGALVPVIHDKP